MTGRKIRDLATQAMQNRWFSYGSIFLLQLKIVWGMWLLRDLSSGDTATYFVAAWDWYRNIHMPMAWSPLYTSFYGTLLHFSPDAYAATVLHRLITVLMVAVLVLALMRSLLPPGIAWLMAAWWVLLPIDFDPLFEIHLFAVIPILTAFLAILWKPGPWGRGCGVAILMADAFLMRNEVLAGALLFAVLAIGWDLRQQYPHRWRAYGIPLAAACLVVLFFYARADDASAGGLDFRGRHTLNVCQAYAVGHQQRHPDWKRSPFTDCHELMTRVYGVSEPSLVEAIGRNPSAMFEHFWWNIQLVPNGLQVLMFNCMSGTFSPDYMPMPARFLTALAASLLMLTIVMWGLAIMWRDREHWWRFWLQDRIWAWVAMGCLAVVAIIVILTQRPRPAYIFSVGIALRALVGMCLFAIASRFPRLQRLQPALPVTVVIAILVAPSYYYVTNPGGARPLLDIYRRLAPFERHLQKSGAGLVVTGWPEDLCAYLGKSWVCRQLDYSDLRAEVGAVKPWDQVLNQHGATMFYVDEAMLTDARTREFVSKASSFGWQLVAMHDQPGEVWSVLERAPDTAPPAAVVAPVILGHSADIIEPESGIALGKGWYDFETFGGERFRWINNDAELVISRPGPVSLQLEVAPGPSLDGKPLSLQAFGNGKTLPVVNDPKGRTVSIRLPSGNMEVRLHVDSVNRITPGDPRILNFRVFKISVQ